MTGGRGHRRGLILSCGVLAAACGRLQFESSTDTSDAATDAGDAGVVMSRSIAAGYAQSCAVTDTILRCWGGNAVGQLGTGDTQGRTSATVIAPGLAWQAVTAGRLHTCALTVAGEVWCWGENTNGQLGQGDLTARSSPARVVLPAAAKSVETWDRSTCALLVTDAIYCWGLNGEGQLGLADSVGAPDALVPVPVASGEAFTQVNPGEAHLLAVAVTGVRWGAGRNAYSELGLGFTNPSQIRTLTMASDGPWHMLSGGQNHSCGVDAARRIYCWGEASNGQLGTGNTTDITLPAQISADPIWAMIDTHTFVGCAVTIAGALACWGRNVEGQLGTGDTAIRLSPTFVSPYSDWTSVSVGWFHTCAMRADGSAWCTGDNGDGQLGTGDMARRDELTLVTF